MVQEPLLVSYPKEFIKKKKKNLKSEKNRKEKCKRGKWIQTLDMILNNSINDKISEREPLLIN